MKRHNIKVYPLAIQVILGNLSHQKAVVIILSTRRQAATQLLYYPRVNKLGENIKNQYLFPSETFSSIFITDFVIIPYGNLLYVYIFKSPSV